MVSALRIISKVAASFSGNCARSTGRPRRRGQLHRILDDRHHAEAEEIDLDDAEVLAIVLVPLRDDAARHAGVLQRHDGIQPPLADDHAAGMLAQVARQPVDGMEERGKSLAARMIRGDAGHVHLLREVDGVRKIAIGIKIGEPVHDIGGKSERLAHLPHGAAPAISDDIGRHRRARAPIAAVNLLDDLFALVSAGQVKVDIRPRVSAALAEEALEEQLVLQRIAVSNPEAVTDRAIGGAAAALHHDVILIAVPDNVPDDEKVTRDAETDDQIEFPCRAARAPSHRAPETGSGRRHKFARRSICGHAPRHRARDKSGNS